MPPTSLFIKPNLLHNIEIIEQKEKIDVNNRNPRYLTKNNPFINKCIGFLREFPGLTCCYCLSYKDIP